MALWAEGEAAGMADGDRCNGCGPLLGCVEQFACQDHLSHMPGQV
jgi:hypothetical protein